MEFHWIDGFEISVTIKDGAVLVSANKEGLLSLANHLMTLAEAPSRDHFHLDADNSLEDGSVELIIEKTESSFPPSGGSILQ